MKNILLIYHRVDYDGLFSACIALSKLLVNPDNQIEKLGFNYNDRLPGPDYISSFDTIIMTDITFPAQVMKELWRICQREDKEFIWLDHHESAINDSINLKYTDIPGIRENGKSATLLTWEYFYGNLKVPEIIQLINDYDIWNNSDKAYWNERVLPVQYALKAQYGLSLDRIYNDIFYRNPELINLNNLVRSGKSILNYLQSNWKSAVNRFGFEIEVGGKYKGICMITTEFSSGPYQSVSDEFDLYCSVNRIGDDKYQLSLYKEPDRLKEFSVGEYLKTTYGGGGHRGAAGCTIDEGTFNKLIHEKVL